MGGCSLCTDQLSLRSEDGSTGLIGKLINLCLKLVQLRDPRVGEGMWTEPEGINMTSERSPSTSSRLSFSPTDLSAGLVLFSL